MDSEWQQFLKASWLIFGLCPLIYFTFWKIFKNNRNVLFLLSLTISSLLLSIKGKIFIRKESEIGFLIKNVLFRFSSKNLIWGTLVLAFITTFFYFLGRLKNTYLIWIFAILYTTATNWYDEVFTQFLSDDLEKTWVYLNEFLVVTQIFRVVSMSLTGKGRNDWSSTYTISFETCC